MWAVEVGKTRGEGEEEEEGERAIDWKQAYKSLFKVISKIKALVLKAGKGMVCFDSLNPGPYLPLFCLQREPRSSLVAILANILLGCCYKNAVSVCVKTVVLLCHPFVTL